MGSSDHFLFSFTFYFGVALSGWNMNAYSSMLTFAW